MLNASVINRPINKPITIMFTGVNMSRLLIIVVSSLDTLLVFPFEYAYFSACPHKMLYSMLIAEERKNNKTISSQEMFE